MVAVNVVPGGCLLKQVDPIEYPFPNLASGPTADELARNFGESMTKLRAWELPFSKVTTCYISQVKFLILIALRPSLCTCMCRHIVVVGCVFGC